MELKRKCLPLKDSKSLRALNAFYALLIGMKMIPGNQHLSLEELAHIVEAMTPDEQLVFLTNGAKIVPLDPDEVKALVCFCTDKNGIPYTAENLKNLGPGELVEVVVTVCMEVIQNIHIDLVTKEEKKNSETSQLTSVGLS
jgi:hypothetical protein